MSELPPEVVAAIVAAVAAREGRAPHEVRLAAARPQAAGTGSGAGATAAWALAGRLQQMRGLSR
jgi:hypothetical protein